MRSMMLETVSLSLQVSTLRVMVWLTGSSSALSAALGKRAYDVALGDDAGEAAVGAKDERRADTLLGEEIARVCQTGARFDGDDLAAFARENDADGHRSLPRFTAVTARARRAADGVKTFGIGAEFCRQRI